MSQEEIDYVGRLRDQAISVLSDLLKEFQQSPKTAGDAEAVRNIIREVHNTFLVVEKSRNEEAVIAAKELFLLDITLAHKALASFLMIDIEVAKQMAAKVGKNLN